MVPTPSRCLPRFADTVARKRFTLIELLVVVSIIAVLAAMLLPALSKARSMAKVANCKSTIRQVSMAIDMYADEQDDYVPHKEVGWSSGLDRYGRSIGSTPQTNAVGRFRDLARLGYMPQEMLYCPAQDRPSLWFTGYLLNQDSGDLIKSHHFGASGDWIYFGGGVMNLGPHPTYDTYTDYSLRRNDMNAAVWPMLLDRIAGPTHRYYTMRSTNHDPGNSRGGNVMYADGHAEWLPLSKTQLAGGNRDVQLNVPLDDQGRSIPHIGHGGLNYYDSPTRVISKGAFRSRGYLYRVP